MPSLYSFLTNPAFPVRFQEIEKGMRGMDLPHASGSLQGQDLLAIEIGFLLAVINDDLIAVFIGHAAHAVRQDLMAFHRKRLQMANPLVPAVHPCDPFCTALTVLWRVAVIIVLAHPVDVFVGIRRHKFGIVIERGPSAVLHNLQQVVIGRVDGFAIGIAEDVAMIDELPERHNVIRQGAVPQPEGNVQAKVQFRRGKVEAALRG